jgi:glycosyltransferase involved in cell wall biosynthesis
MEKNGRNDPCPCGSGKKHKYCCLSKDSAQAAKGIAFEAQARLDETVQCNQKAYCREDLPVFTEGQPRLSICIPTYNRAAILRETLTHLEKVCGEDTEIVISDNCSPDETPQVIEDFRLRFRHFRAVRQPENIGPSKNGTAVHMMATGRYSYALSDDDQIYPEGINAAVKVMEDDPSIVGVFGNYAEWIRNSNEVHIQTLTDQRIDFARGDKLAIFNRFSLLWLPVCRTDIFQRFGIYDGKSWGMWPLVGTLIEHGGITVIPEILYRHAHTEPRQEYNLTEAWYHDFHRSQYETYLGRIGSGDFSASSKFIDSRVNPAYLQGVRFAAIKKEALTARHFILRARAYGLSGEEDVLRWERENMAAMVAERLIGFVDLSPGIKQVVFDCDERIIPFLKSFAFLAPGYDTTVMLEADWRDSPSSSDSFLVTYAFQQAAAERSRYRAICDLVETCRITDQPLDLSPHLALDGKTG